MEDYYALANDPSVLATWPGAKILNVKQVHESPWAKGFRLIVRQADGRDESYFMKVSTGDHGRLALVGEFKSTSAILDIVPGFCPKPVALGSFENNSNSHFYICEFCFFKENEDAPKSDSFYEKLARLHSNHTTSDGKFGFYCTTYNGNIPQDNTWSDSWEEFFTNGLRHVLDVREERAGYSAGLDALLPKLFDKVIPRLLRPLERGEQKIKPSLVHGNLWYGNIGITNDNEKIIVYDAASFWAHNEYELGNWRPERNKFTADHFKKYHAHMDKSEPREDYDDRNALYALKYNLQAAALFPDDGQYIQLAIEDARRLVEKYPGGYTDNA